jgi:hypothetical protein
MDSVDSDQREPHKDTVAREVTKKDLDALQAQFDSQSDRLKELLSHSSNKETDLSLLI